MVTLVNDLAGASQEDIDNLAEHLKDAVPECSDELHVALRDRVSITEMVQGVIFNLVAIHEHRPRLSDPLSPPPELSAEERMDSALRKTKNSLGAITDAQWERAARGANRHVADLRQACWQSVYQGLWRTEY